MNYLFENHHIVFIVCLVLFVIVHNITVYFKIKLDLCSLIHTCITVFMSHYIVFTNKVPSFSSCLNHNEKINTFYENCIQLCLILSLAFSFIDIYTGCTLRRYDYIVHGLLFLISTMYVYYKNTPAIYIHLILIEASTIFFLFIHNKQMWIKYGFFILFTIYRVFYLLYLSFIAFSYIRHKLIYCLLLLTLTILNLYWYSIMIKKLIRHMKKE